MNNTRHPLKYPQIQRYKTVSIAVVRAAGPCIIALLLIVLLAWALSPSVLRAAPVSAQEETASSDLILVGLEPDAAGEDLPSLFAAQGLQLVTFWPEFNLAAVRSMPTASARSAAQMLQSASALPLVRFVEADARIEAAVVETGLWVEPNDPSYVDQWALNRIGMPAAWQLTQGNPSVVVAVVDSGVEITHEDLGLSAAWTNLVELNGAAGVDDDANGYVDDIHGWDWVDDDDTPLDLFGHGTHVAGTLVAATNNGIGVAGMSPNLRILPLRVLDARGSGFISDLIAALDYARAQGAQIVNLSLVLRFDSTALYDVLTRLYADDMLVVAATGNFGNQVFWPAAYTETLAVAAVNSQDERAGFSNYGDQTDVAAPGVDVLSTYNGNSYYENSGTSMAVPHVSALAALIWGLRPDLSHTAVIDLILGTAVDVNSAEFPGVDPYLGHGRIDAAAALRAAAQAINIDVHLPRGSYLSVGQPLQIPVRLTVTDTQGSQLPVSGAVVEVTILDPAQRNEDASFARLESKRFYSDESGYVMGTLTLPAEPGSYTLQVGLGSQTKTLMLDVQASPLALSISPAVTGIEVGSGMVDLSITARTQSGHLFTDDLLLTVYTTLGRFADGAQTHTVILSGGVLTETLFAGEVAGMADVYVELGEQTQQTTVLFKPGAPYRLVGPEKVVGFNYGSGATVDISLKIYDQYGNKVWAAYPINFYSTGGEFSPESVRAVDGEVTVQFTMGPWVRTPQPIWAMIPGTFAIYRVDAEMISNPRFLPLVMGD